MVAVTLKHSWHNVGYVANWIKDSSFLGYGSVIGGVVPEVSKD